MSEELDVLKLASPYRRTEFSRRRGVTVEGVQVWLVAPEDLLRLSDARNLIAHVADLDWAYVEHWGGELAVLDLLGEVRR